MGVSPTRVHYGRLTYVVAITAPEVRYRLLPSLSARLAKTTRADRMARRIREARAPGITLARKGLRRSLEPERSHPHRCHPDACHRDPSRLKIRQLTWSPCWWRITPT